MKKELTKQQQSYINSLLDARKKRTEKSVSGYPTKDQFSEIQFMEKQYTERRKDFYNEFQLLQRIK